MDKKAVIGTFSVGSYPAGAEKIIRTPPPQRPCFIKNHYMHHVLNHVKI